jgi:phosphatidylserine decarboxylase
MAHVPEQPEPAPIPWYAYPYVALQYLLPHHLLSALIYRLARYRWAPLKDQLIRRFVRAYQVQMAEAQEPDPGAYPSFNAFFTRPLRPEVRPLDPAADGLLCPVDGTLSQFGPIRDDRLLQAKGQGYELLELLGGTQDWAERFRGGDFITLYLSPRDYHRVHMPLAGDLQRTLAVPGRLFSVNLTTSRLVPRLFARNERVIALFETPWGPLAVILVGAIFVASIDTVWAGTLTPPSRRSAAADPATPLQLGRGAEMGRFNMGSTVILLLPPGRVNWGPQLRPGLPVRMGQRLGRMG